MRDPPRRTRAAAPRVRRAARCGGVPPAAPVDPRSRRRDAAARSSPSWGSGRPSTARAIWSRPLGGLGARHGARRPGHAVPVGHPAPRRADRRHRLLPLRRRSRTAAHHGRRRRADTRDAAPARPRHVHVVEAAAHHGRAGRGMPTATSSCRSCSRSSPPSLTAIARAARCAPRRGRCSPRPRSSRSRSRWARPSPLVPVVQGVVFGARRRGVARAAAGVGAARRRRLARRGPARSGAGVAARARRVRRSSPSPRSSASPRAASRHRRRPAYVLRDVVIPPFDVREYPSPLQSFRAYVRDHPDEALFTVAGLPEGARVRLATMDAYDGTVYNVSDEGAGSSSAFTPVRANMSADAEGTRRDGARRDRRAGERVDAGCRRRHAASTFDGDRADDLRRAAHYNEATGDGRRDGAASRRATPTRSTRCCPPSRSDESLADVALRAAEDAEAATACPQSLAEIGVEGRRRGDDADRAGAGAAVHALGGRLLQPRPRGSRRSRAPATAPSASRRCSASQQMVGDDEQYAAAMALLAGAARHPRARRDGLLPRRGARRGSRVFAANGDTLHAWVEVAFEGAGWVPFDPTPPEDQVPNDQTTKPKADPKPQVLQPPPPAAGARRPAADGAGRPRGRGRGRASAGAILRPHRRDRRRRRSGLLAAARRAVHRDRRAQGHRAGASGSRRERAADRISGGWDELVDRAAGLRHAGASGRHAGPKTRRAVGAAFAEPRVATLARRADVEVFGPDRARRRDDVEEFWRQVDEIVGGMAASARCWERVRARLSVRSLLAGTRFALRPLRVRSGRPAAEQSRPPTGAPTPRRRSGVAPHRQAPRRRPAVPAGDRIDRQPARRRRPRRPSDAASARTRSTSASPTASRPCSSAIAVGVVFGVGRGRPAALAAAARCLTSRRSPGCSAARLGAGLHGHAGRPRLDRQRAAGLRLQRRRHRAPRSGSGARSCATSCGASPHRSSSATSRRSSTRSGRRQGWHDKASRRRGRRPAATRRLAARPRSGRTRRRRCARSRAAAAPAPMPAPAPQLRPAAAPRPVGGSAPSTAASPPRRRDAVDRGTGARRSRVRSRSDSGLAITSRPRRRASRRAPRAPAAAPGPHASPPRVGRAPGRTCTRPHPPRPARRRRVVDPTTAAPRAAARAAGRAVRRRSGDRRAHLGRRHAHGRVRAHALRPQPGERGRRGRPSPCATRRCRSRRRISRSAATPTGAWIVDRHSTNGTTLVRDGGRIPLRRPACVTPLHAGDALEFGDRVVARGRRVDDRPTPPITVACGAATDAGLRRTLNEDSFLAALAAVPRRRRHGRARCGRDRQRHGHRRVRGLAGRPSLDDRRRARRARPRARTPVEAAAGDRRRCGARPSAGVVIADVDGEAYWLALNLGDSRTYRLSEGALRAGQRRPLRGAGADRQRRARPPTPPRGTRAATSSPARSAPAATPSRTTG